MPVIFLFAYYNFARKHETLKGDTPALASKLIERRLTIRGLPEFAAVQSMKPLIRPTLFTVARLGLFLSLSACVITQWWELEGAIRCGAPVVIVGHPRGFLLSIFPPNQRTWYVTARPVEDDAWWTHLEEVEKVVPYDFGFQTVGLTVDLGPNAPFTSIRHWLIVSIFVLFYGVLKLVYRKRPGKSSATQSQGSVRQSLPGRG